MVILLMKFLHVAAAFWFLAGLLGRTLTQWQASRATDVQQVGTLTTLAGYFERWMVIPGSFAVLGFGLITAWAQRWPVLGTATPALWLLVSTLLYLSLIPVVPLVFLPRGRVFEAALSRALAQGEVTAELTAAMRDRAVRLAHAYEFAAVGVITLLMVLKPF